MDPLFRVDVVTATPNPQTACWVGMHQDYSEGYVCHDHDAWPTERQAGEIAVRRLLAGERGHYGPLEHAQIVFNVGYFPHSVMQQARTHRVGVSFDVQSLRYTGARVCAAARGELHLEDVFYLRPVGSYSDRQGKRYEYTAKHRADDLTLLGMVARYYERRVTEFGFAEEHARGLLAFDVRQHFVVSFSLRALLHFLDLRAKLDAQQEIRWLCDLLWPHLQAWAPEIAGWYQTTRLGKARLAP
jgi:thymidylate synthase (FAD)